MNETLTQFLDAWIKDPNAVKPTFLAYKELVTEEGISLSFTARPRISYSLRAKAAQQKDRDLFMVLDVIDDEPESRWLSLCFYADMVTDPEELGDFVPSGLFGADARCFSIEGSDPSLIDYAKERIREAKKAAQGR